MLVFYNSGFDFLRNIAVSCLQCPTSFIYRRTITPCSSEKMSIRSCRRLFREALYFRSTRAFWFTGQENDHTLSTTSRRLKRLLDVIIDMNKEMRRDTRIMERRSPNK